MKTAPTLQVGTPELLLAWAILKDPTLFFPNCSSGLAQNAAAAALLLSFQTQSQAEASTRETEQTQQNPRVSHPSSCASAVPFRAGCGNQKCAGPGLTYYQNRALVLLLLAST